MLTLTRMLCVIGVIALLYGGVVNGTGESDVDDEENETAKSCTIEYTVVSRGDSKMQC